MKEGIFKFNQENSNKAIEHDLQASGISNESEWRKVYETENFDILFSYLDEAEKNSNETLIEHFKDTESADYSKRLNLLRSMSLLDAIQCIRDYSVSPIAYSYLIERLVRYQKLIEKESYNSVSPSSIKLGILRDLFHAAMMGTPEMGAVAIANKRIKIINPESKGVATFSGYYSGIFEEGDEYRENLGLYPALNETYKNAQRVEETRLKKTGFEMSNEEIEHKAVLRMADWLVDINKNYCDQLCYSGESNSIDPSEALSWAQLGDETKKRILNIKKKIEHKYLDFRNIARFIGKSGDNKYSKERRKLRWQINNFEKLIQNGDDNQPHLIDYAYQLRDLENALELGEISQEDFESKKVGLEKWFEENKISFLDSENQKALEKENERFELETSKIQSKYQKRLSILQKLDLPDHEKKLQLDSIDTEYEKMLVSITTNHEEQSNYFSSRTSDELLNDLKESYILIQKKYEKTKNLAEKALDLNSKLNHYGVKNAGLINWFSFAPFGVIKRAHKMMHLGISNEIIGEYSLLEIATGSDGVTREDLNFLHDLLKNFGEDSPISKNSFSKQIAIVKKKRDKYGINLTFQEVAKIASGEINNLDDAFKLFDLETIRILLREDSNISVAGYLLNATRKIGYDLDIKQIKILAKETTSTINSLLESFRHLQIDKNVKSSKEELIQSESNTISKLDMSTAIDLIKLNHSDFVNKFAEVFYIPSNVIDMASSHHIYVSESLVYHQTAPEDKEQKEIFEILHDNIPEWKDEENIASPFREGAAIFGEEKMFKYLDKKGLSRHDGLHQFKKIIELYHASHLSPNEFYNNILQQVSRDESEYYSGTAYHHLNAMSASLSLDFEKFHALMKEYQHIQKLKELSADITSGADIFASWKDLKKYKEVQDLLAQKEILEQLTDLKNYPEKAKLREYIETLAFHPNISMEAVLSFWRTPEKFFDLSDGHTPKEVHSRKKPSNYIEFPHLDLSAQELRDALVEGSYDSLQSFKPFSIEYTLEQKSQSTESTISILNRALGKRSEGKKGEAKNPPKLFKALQQYSKEKHIDLKKVLAGELLLSPDDESAIITLLYQEESGLPQKKGKQEIYRAKINKKSDPDAVVAGNDTACCMPFGSGKNNVYTFNPNCSLFTLQRRSGNGEWRTIAQSVLTEDVIAGRKIPDIITEVEHGELRLNKIIPEDILSNQKSIIACDNIEVAENFKGNDTEIKIIYQDFFREYVKHYGERDNLETSKVVIGKGYTDALTGLPQETNVFIPRAPVGYSDKLGESVYSLSLQEQYITNKKIISKEVINQEVPPEITDTSSLPKGVNLLTFRDSLPVAYIEGKAYAENESLIEYLHNMENALIAKDVNNSVKHRPNMSLKYTGDDNKIHGYILAYEGKIEKEGESVVYVSDLASDGNARAGGSLILGFTEQYKHYYIDQNHLLPIYAQMREKTSYPIIKKQLDKLAKGSGIQFEIEEVSSYEAEGDTMHTVMIRPVLYERK